MAIHDVSKDHPERADPMPNSHDVPKETFHNAMPFTHSTGRQTLLRLVDTLNIQVTNDGSTLTTASEDHNLGYAPIVIAALNHTNITTADSTGVASNASILLPNFLGATISGGNVNFSNWLYAFANDTKVYINLLNATGNPISPIVTLYLLQQVAD